MQVPETNVGFGILESNKGVGCCDKRIFERMITDVLKCLVGIQATANMLPALFKFEVG